jgi:hypothetical protein
MLLSLAASLVWLYGVTVAAGLVLALVRLGRSAPDDGSEDGPPGGSKPPDEPQPGPPAWDWDRFERELNEYSRQVVR